jgi:electron transfer flavoprotein alpha/beta subunit
MRQVVLLKDIPDLTEIKINSETRAPILEGVKHKISEVDKRALEEAIRLKEIAGGEVIVLSMGDENTQTAMLEAMAMGADSAYIINESGFRGIDANATSIVLKAALEHIGKYDLVLAGEMSLDSLGSQVGPRLAELVHLPLITYVKKLEAVDGAIKAVRDLEDMDMVVKASLPALVCVVREINEPRIPNLMNIMRAKKKPQTILNADSLGLSTEDVKKHSHVKILNVEAPKTERKQIKIEAGTVEEAANKLASALRSDGVLQ